MRIYSIKNVDVVEGEDGEIFEIAHAVRRICDSEGDVKPIIVLGIADNEARWRLMDEGGAAFCFFRIGEKELLARVRSCQRRYTMATTPH